MPNGVSCLFFAGKNLIYGKKEDNLFKEGIGVIQTVRGADYIASSNILGKSASAAGGIVNPSKNPVLAFLGDTAKVLKKILYPLFIFSGVYNTIKSDDKVKTGTKQAAGIGLMYTFEQFTEKNLERIEKRIFAKAKASGSTKAKVAWYILRGAIYAATSMLGYNAGTKAAEFSVDGIRNIKDKKAQKAEMESKLDSVTNYVFEDIESVF